MTRVAVIGAGSWGTAVSALVAQNADEVVLWSHGSEGAKAINETHRNPRYLTDVELPANITATSDLPVATKGADAVVLATPSTHLRTISHELADTVGEELPVVVLTKGIEAGSGLLMSEVVADELGHEHRVLALSGPNHAEEVSHGMFSCAVLASPDRKLAERMRPLVATPTFRVYVSEDIRGVETCGAVKNVIAIACGVCAGLGLGDNTLAAVMTRGIAEIGRVVAATGGQPMTCMGLAGMGDLVATCTSEHSRNRRFGEAFVRGTTLEQFERRTHMVVEGAHSATSVRELAQARGVEVPIVEGVWNLIHGGLSIEEVASSLRGRVPNTEFYGMGNGPASK